MPITSLDGIRERLRAVLSRLSTMNNQSPIEPAVNELQELIEQSLDDLHSLDGKAWYLTEDKKFEKRNLYISLAPTIIGVILIGLVFFWTIRLANEKQQLEYDKQDLERKISAINDSVLVTRKQLEEIYRRSSDGLALQLEYQNEYPQFGQFKNKTDSIFNRIREIIDNNSRQISR
jgi:hypothetical protein